MVDFGRLRSLLQRIADELAELELLAGEPDDVLASDRRALPAAKYRLLVAVEAAIDAAEHIIASESLRASESFADAFVALEESGYIDTDVSAAMQDAARFRNLLVHGYAHVDDDRVVEVMRTRLGDLERFRSVLAAWVSYEE